jgi:hypothetical protein
VIGGITAGSADHPRELDGRMAVTRISTSVITSKLAICYRVKTGQQSQSGTTFVYIAKNPSGSLYVSDYFGPKSESVEEQQGLGTFAPYQGLVPCAQLLFARGSPRFDHRCPLSSITEIRRPGSNHIRPELQVYP